MSNQYLFLFSIAPVQSFIAQARKTQDLYAGSRILTELCRRGLQEVVTFHKATCIFPSNDQADSLPNRFLVSLEANDIKSIGQTIEAVVRTYWKDCICEKVMNFGESPKQTNGIKGIKQQIENHLDINWAFVDIDTEGGYAKAYEKIERLLGAVKNARSFTQFNYQKELGGELGEKGRKCSVDGERNVKFYRLTESEVGKETDVTIKKLFTTEDEVFIDKYDYKRSKFSLAQLQPGEGLSAVSMAKRLFKTETFRPETFRSTADIAMLYSIRYLFSGKMIVQTCAYRKHFDSVFSGSVPFNAQLYFEENLTENYFKKQGYSNLISSLKDIKEDRKALEKTAKEAKYPFLKYYTIIDFDGDSMGKWLSGNKEKVNEGIDLKDFHKALSSRLAVFAEKAKEIVNKYGQTVYAGGDDFLGFVNLNYLFAAMTELRNAFKCEVNKHLKGFMKPNQEITFSAGVCIAHYKEPLSMVIDKAGKAQKIAKHETKGDRDAFCIVASKHSGENHETYFKWGNDCSNVSKLQDIVSKLITDGSYSNTFIKSLTIEFSRLADNDGKLKDDTLLRAETYRLVKRSNMFKRDYDKGETKEEFEERKKKANILLTDTIMALLVKNNFNNFISALHICDFMHRLIATGNDMGELLKTEKELCTAL